MVFYADLCLVWGFLKELGSSLLPGKAKLAADCWKFVGWDRFLRDE